MTVCSPADGSKPLKSSSWHQSRPRAALGSDLQDTVAYLVTEQLAEPSEYCREKRVSTKDPHEKDSPGALPAEERTSPWQVRALDIASMSSLGPWRGQGSSKRWSLYNTAHQSSIVSLSDKLSLSSILGTASPCLACGPSTPGQTKITLTSLGTQS